ncbi:unnamed protein product [Lactuca virosa]|uniref:Uncharacterized protein n=1 Tax=Lactuca virosa TaxID=75947 RepID=A0AAU9PLR1_9ASTR|nr:unnamed protein product [Lactuca virosa]
MKKLQKHKDHLRINLTKAEEEVIVLCDENDILDKENWRLTNLIQKEHHILDSGGKHSSESIKGQNLKRKSSPCPKEGSPIEKKMDFYDAAGSPRKPLSPLLHNKLKPSTQVVLVVASEMKKLQKHKDHLRINLTKAEEEVIVLCDENDILDKENWRLTNLIQKEHHILDSGGKHSSESIKGQNLKRKSSPCPKEGSPIEKKMDFYDAAGSPRKPLSPLLHNK